MKIFRIAILVLVMLVFFGCDETQAKVMKDKTVVSVPVGDNVTMQFAASELADYLNRMMGVDYQVAKEEKPAKNAAVRLGIDNTLAHDGYHIFIKAGYVKIDGGSWRGCLYGCYEFLKELGCYFPLPGKDKEYIPKLTQIDPGDIDIKSEPAVGTRAIDMAVMTYSDDLLVMIDYMAKNKYNDIVFHGGVIPEDFLLKIKQELIKRDMAFEWGGHYLPGYLPRDLFKEHPEYFRMENGKRTPELNMCPSSEEGADIIAGNSLKDWIRLKDVPRFEVLHIWVDDLTGGGWCSCPKCAGLSCSEQALKIVNEVAKRLPLPEGTTLSHIAYHETIEYVPTKVKANDRVNLLYAARERCYKNAMGQGKANSQYYKWLKEQYEAMPVKAQVFEYYQDPVLFRQLPMPLHPVIGKDIQAYHAVGVDRIGSLAFQTYGEYAYGVNYYVLGKCLWRGKGDAVDIKEYCKGLYGPSAEDMETYFDMLYEFCATAMETDGYEGYADMRFPPYQAFTKEHAEKLAPLVTKEHIQKIENKLNQGLAGSVEPYRSRIKIQIELWKVAKLEVPAIYYTLVSAYKTPEILASKGSEAERVELIKNTKIAVENIRAAGEIILSMPADVRGPHMFKDGGMVGSERMKYYPMALNERVTKLEEYGQLKDIVKKDAVVEKLAGDFAFVEGPTAVGDGVLFSDIPKDKIYKWSAEKGLSVFRDDIKAPNGLFFDDMGRLIVCAGGSRQLLAIDGSGGVTILADRFEDKQLNSPNDNWPDPKGGIYFTDPRYGNRDNMQMEIEGVYYLSKDGKLSRVIDDFVRPNGIIGSPDGSVLYIADHGDSKIWAYKINPDSTLSDKKLFFNQGSDGMTVDSRGNIYLTCQLSSSVLVINPKGEQIAQIKVPEPPANVCFGGTGNKTLFITAVTSLYSVDTNVEGVKRESTSKPGLFFE